jgi:hypothetical protein
MKTTFSLLVLIFISAAAMKAQDADSLLNSMTTPATDYESATFKATRIVNGQSVEQMKEGQLDFRIHHRFGPVNSGAYNLWGLDQSNIFFGLEYGALDWLMVGVGRSTYQKTYDGFLKFRLWRQSTGEHNMPVSISLYTGTDINTLSWTDPTRTNYFSSRLAYTFQGLIGRKFSDELSIQLSPTIVHKNIVPLATDWNDTYAVGIGARYKLSARISFNAEYFYTYQHLLYGETRKPDSFSFGFDIETGGHVFQIMLTNSLAMIERGFIAENSDSWSSGGIHLGFNISRVFTLY